MENRERVETTYAELREGDMLAFGYTVANLYTHLGVVYFQARTPGNVHNRKGYPSWPITVWRD